MENFLYLLFNYFNKILCIILLFLCHRAGNKGYAYTFITPEQGRYAGDIVRALELSGVPVPDDVRNLWESYKAKQVAVSFLYFTLFICVNIIHMCIVFCCFFYSISLFYFFRKVKKYIRVEVLVEKGLNSMRMKL